jgi:hypothetical protein
MRLTNRTYFSLFTRRIIRDKKGATEKDLYKLLHELGYDGVRLKDCALALTLAEIQGPLPKGAEPKY